MRSRTPFTAIDLQICLHRQFADVINRAKLFENRSKGLGATGPRKVAFPVEKRVHRPYTRGRVRAGPSLQLASRHLGFGPPSP